MSTFLPKRVTQSLPLSSTPLSSTFASMRTESLNLIFSTRRIPPAVTRPSASTFISSSRSAATPPTNLTSSASSTAKPATLKALSPGPSNSVMNPSISNSSPFSKAKSASSSSSISTERARKMGPKAGWVPEIAPWTSASIPSRISSRREPSGSMVAPAVSMYCVPMKKVVPESPEAMPFSSSSSASRTPARSSTRVAIMVPVPTLWPWISTTTGGAVVKSDWSSARPETFP